MGDLTDELLQIGAVGLAAGVATKMVNLKLEKGHKSKSKSVKLFKHGRLK